MKNYLLFEKGSARVENHAKNCQEAARELILENEEIRAAYESLNQHRQTEIKTFVKQYKEQEEKFNLQQEFFIKKMQYFGKQLVKMNLQKEREIFVKYETKPETIKTEFQALLDSFYS